MTRYNKMEQYYRTPVEEFNEKELSFQALEWQDCNQEEFLGLANDDDMMVDNEQDSLNYDKSMEKYLIKIFGVNKKGQSVCLNVNDFTPFFYIKVPDTWGKNSTDTFLMKISQMLSKTKKKQKNLWVNYDYSKNILAGKCILQEKHDFYGFTNNRKFKFLRLVFNNSDAMKKTVSIIKNHNSNKKKITGYGVLNLYESNLDPIIRFAHIKNLKFSGWLKTTDHVTLGPDFTSTTCQIECSVNWQKIEPLDDNTNAPILQASYDIETYSYDGKFPSPIIKENVITQIATTFKYFGEKDFYFKHIVCLKQCSPLQQEDDVPIFMEWYNTEKEVLMAWKRLITRTDPDILYQYNGDQFDGYYIHTRSMILNCNEDFSLGKIKNTPCTISENVFSSSAYGSTSFKRLTMPGRINFDILIYIKREYNENSYKLDYVSEKYLGENKNPITAAMMFKYFEQGDPDRIRDVAYYCIKDTLLPQKLVDKMHILQNQISMSNVTYVPIRFLVERGQQIKVFSQILKETRKQDYLVPTIDNYGSNSDNSVFTGATVLPPLKDAYFEPVTVCDFASLYPSIIRAHNLCFSTIVLDKKYDNIKNADYNTIEWEDTVGDKQIKHKYKFVQNKTGILPKLLSELTTARKNYKKLMNDCEDPFLKEVYNKSQLAVKVSMNSIYGFLAAPMLCCKPIAACVTAIGRSMIKDTKDYMEKHYNASTAVYGDSVTGDTAILLKDPSSGKIVIKTIQSISCNIWVPYKEFKPFDTNRKDKFQAHTDYLVWTDQGWSKIKRVIKHATNKTIYRVVTRFGCLEATEDHSLLSKDKELLKPYECGHKTELLHSYPEHFYELETINDHASYMLGVFDAHNTSNINDYYIDKLINSDYSSKMSYLQGLSENNDLIFTNKKSGYISGFKCYNSLFCSKLYFLLCSIYGTSVSIDTEFYSNVTSDIYYCIYLPSEDRDSIQSITNNVKYVYPINKRTNRLELFSEEYNIVYDLETDIGRFQAGIGQNIIKNTDSVFIKFTTNTSEQFRKAIDNPELFSKQELHELKTKCIQESINLGKIAAKNATRDLFKHPINLEYEKVYCPLLLLSKKRYIGNLYSEDASKVDKMDNKGVVLKRRDNFDLLKKTYKHIINIIMSQGKSGITEVIDYLQSILYKIVNNEFEDLQDFIISKSLKDNYKSKNIPHVVLAEKIKQREPNNAPKSNDRVPYVFTNPDIKTEIGRKWLEDIKQKREEEFIEKVKKETSKSRLSFEEAQELNKKLPKKILMKTGAKLNQYEKVEDPEYMLEHNLPLDAEYYINFMKIPISEILALFIEDPEEIFQEILNEYHNSMW